MFTENTFLQSLYKTTHVFTHCQWRKLDSVFARCANLDFFLQFGKFHNHHSNLIYYFEAIMACAFGLLTLNCSSQFSKWTIFHMTGF